jgi:hypothetical protein
MAWNVVREFRHKPPGRSTTLGPRRPTVGTGFPDDPDDAAGTAGVREPRRPLPNPLSAAAELPEPEPFTYVTLADARR